MTIATGPHDDDSESIEEKLSKLRVEREYSEKILTEALRTAEKEWVAAGKTKGDAVENAKGSTDNGSVRILRGVYIAAAMEQELLEKEIDLYLAKRTRIISNFNRMRMIAVDDALNREELDALKDALDDKDRVLETQDDRDEVEEEMKGLRGLLGFKEFVEQEYDESIDRYRDSIKGDTPGADRVKYEKECNQAVNSDIVEIPELEGE